MRRAALTLILLALAVGCGKKAEEESPASTSPPAGDRSGAAPAPVPVRALTDWVVVDEVAVRVEKVRLMKPVVEDPSGMGSPEKKDIELDDVELVVWLKVENRTRARKIDYEGWDRLSFLDVLATPKLTDEHGNVYRLCPHDLSLSPLKGKTKECPLNPGDQPVTDIVCFERIVPAATKLTLVLPSLDKKSTATYRFEIPAAAWR